MIITRTNGAREESASKTVSEGRERRDAEELPKIKGSRSQHVEGEEEMAKEGRKAGENVSSVF